MRKPDCLNLHPQQRIKFSEAIHVGAIVTGASVSRSKIQNGLPWNFRGVPGKVKNGRRYHAWDSERVFKLDLGVFPADERVETNEVGNLRWQNVKQAF